MRLLNRSRAVSGLGNISLVLQDLKDTANQVTATTNAEGKLVVPKEIIAANDYVAVIEDKRIQVTANTDGEDVGTIVITEGINFKTSVVLRDANTYTTYTEDLMSLYAGSANKYGIDIVIRNVSPVTSNNTTFYLTVPPDVHFTGNAQGILGTVSPGRTNTIEMRDLYCSSLSNESEYRKIDVRIVDNRNGTTWNDSVSLRFNREMVNFQIKATGAQGADGTARGMIIVPGGKAYAFNASGYASAVNPSQYARVVRVPRYSGKPYLVVFSGATEDSETAYAFKVGSEPAVIPSDFMPDEWYFQHDSEENAKFMNHNDEIRSFLSYKDIRYFKVVLP